MNYIKFGQIFDFQKKSHIKAGDGLDSGTFPFFTSSQSLSKYSNSPQFTIPSLIFGTGGNASIHLSIVPFSISTDCLVAQLSALSSGKFEIKFIYYYLFGNIHILEDGFKGAGLKHISKDYINNIDIPELSIEEQRRVVNVLDQNSILRQKRNQSLLLVDKYLKSSFLEIFGDRLKNDKKWPIVEIKDLCSVIVDCPHSTPTYSDSKTEYPCIRSSDMQNGFLDFSSTKYVDEKQYLERIERCKPKGGDIFYCREGARFGANSYIPEGISVCLGQRTMLFRIDAKVATSEFLWGSLNSRSITYQAAKLVNGAASPHVNVKDIKKYKVFKPPLELQQKYSNIFSNSVLIKKSMHEQLNVLEMQFKALIQRAFN